MIEIQKAKVHPDGDGQTIDIPAAFRIDEPELYIRRNELNGDIILSKAPHTMAEILAAFAEIDVPADFLSPEERNLGLLPERQIDL